MATRRRRSPQASAGWRRAGHDPLAPNARRRCGRPGSSRWTGRTRGAVDAAIAGGEPRAGLGAAGRRRATRCWRGTARRWRRRGRAGSGYLSTTGVYGDRQGGWVDEDERAARRSTSASRWRVAAEAAWLASGLPVQRLPARRHLRAGAQRLRPAARGTGAAGGEAGAGVQPHPRRRHRRGARAPRWRGPTPGRVYNVADDEPAPPQDVIAFAAELLGMPAPPEVPLEDGGAVADGAELLRGVEAGVEPADQRGARRRRSPIPDYRAGLRGDPRGRRAEGRGGNSRGENRRGLRFRAGNRGRHRPKIRKIGMARPDRAVEVGGMSRRAPARRSGHAGAGFGHAGRRGATAPAAGGDGRGRA